ACGDRSHAVGAPPSRPDRAGNESGHAARSGRAAGRAAAAARARHGRALTGRRRAGAGALSRAPREAAAGQRNRSFEARPPVEAPEKSAFFFFDFPASEGGHSDGRCARGAQGNVLDSSLVAARPEVHAASADLVTIVGFALAERATARVADG